MPKDGADCNGLMTLFSLAAQAMSLEPGFDAVRQHGYFGWNGAARLRET
jgi:hypothetical protein